MLQTKFRGAWRALGHSGSSLRVMSTAQPTAGDYCIDIVKQNDFDSYLAGLLVPTDSRSAYFAVRAFNVELAMVRDQINNNSMAGRIRFQWWRDVIRDIYEGGGSSASQSPVATALRYHIDDKSLSSHWFERSIDARQKDLSGAQPQTLDDLEDYAEQGHSSVLYLLLESLGVRDQESEYAASHVGVCSGITTIMRGFPHHASQSQMYIPTDVMADKNLEMNTFLKGPSSREQRQALRDSVFEMASQAYGHLDKARSLSPSKKAIHALLPAVRASMFLEKLRQVDFDPYDSSLYEEESHLQFQLKLLYASTMKKI